MSNFSRPIRRVIEEGTVPCLFFFALFTLILFYPVLFQGEIFSWRDAGHFYYPLFKEIQDCWQAMELPLWDPYENIGQPLAANATSSVWYPVRVLFFLPLILPVDYGFCFNAYTLLHFFIAMLGTFHLMRHWRFSVTASLLTTISYCFSGSVLTQYTNIIFLVGAAWLPWSMMAGSTLLQHQRVRDIVPLALTLALSILGGDPQMAYLTGLLLGGLWLVYLKEGRYPQVRKPKFPLKYYYLKKVARGPLGLLTAAALLAGMIAAIQIIPSAEMTKNSVRQWNLAPHSIWEIPSFLLFPHEKPITLYSQESPEIASKRHQDTHSLKKVVNGLFCQEFNQAGYPRTIYDWSVPPYQYVELFAPGIYGNSVTSDRTRWTWEGKSNMQWSLSLYLGIIPLLLALTAFSLRAGSQNPLSNNYPFCNCLMLWRMRARCPRSQEVLRTTLATRRSITTWASWLTLLGLLAGLGGFGLGWFWRCFLAMFGSAQDLNFADGDPVGGIYWLMNILLPKFSSFRFPGKMLVPASLGLAVLAGIGWDVLRRKKILLKRGLFLVLLLLVALILAYLVLPTLLTSSWCNPEVERTLVLCMVLKGFGHSLLVTLVFLLMIFLSRHPSKYGRGGVNITSFNMASLKMLIRKVAPLLVLLLTTADLLLAHRGLVGTIPESDLQTIHALSDRMKENSSPEYLAAGVPIRYNRFEWQPFTLAKSNLPDHARQILRWHHASLRPKHHEGRNLAAVDSPGTMQFLEYWLLGDWCYHYRYSPDPLYVMAFLGTDFFLYPPELVVTKSSPHAFDIMPEEARCLLEGLQEMPAVSPETGLPCNVSLWSVQLPRERIRIYHDSPRLANPQTSLFDLLDANDLGNPLPGEFARFTKYQRNRIMFETKLLHCADLLLAEQYAPGWKARVTSLDNRRVQSVPVEKSLGLLRKISLPQGEYQVTMIYSPLSFYLGILVSGLGILIAAALVKC